MDRQKVARHIPVMALALAALPAGCGSDDASAADDDRPSAGTVVQDDLQNTYQRVDEGVEG